MISNLFLAFDYQKGYSILFHVSLIIIALLLLATVIKSIIGPRITDRIVTINIVGTLVTSCIGIIAISDEIKHEEYLIDICIIYVLISFIAVVVLTNVFINQYLQKKIKEDKDNGNV